MQVFVTLLLFDKVLHWFHSSDQLQESAGEHTFAEGRVPFGGSQAV